MKRINPHSIIVLAAAAICVAFIYNLTVNFLEERALDKIVSGELSSAKISAKDMVGKLKHVYIEKRYWVKDDFPFSEFRGRLEKALKKNGFIINSELRVMKRISIKGKEEAREEVSYVITEPHSSIPLLRLTLIHRISGVAPARPRIAIVLDDWGYNTNNLEEVLQISKPITLSILPNLPYSTTVANKAKERGFEVIMHMPMEPKAKMRLEIATLYTTMSDDEIRSTFNRSLQTVPDAAGISNHEGSRATEDMRLMAVLFGELKKNDMFFLDSLVTNDSVGEYLAKKTGVRFAKRSTFLDNESNPDYIKKQFEKAVGLALRKGDVIAIGHDKANTIAVLREMVPKLEERGVDLVPVSKLAR